MEQSSNTFLKQRLFTHKRIVNQRIAMLLSYPHEVIGDNFCTHGRIDKKTTNSLTQ